MQHRPLFRCFLPGLNAYCSGGSCYCNSGYEGNASSGCTKIPSDPCTGVTCGANAYCSNGSCFCNSGYEGNAASGCTKIENCTYTTTASSCSSQCKNVGSSSCTKNGTTYYNGCGASKCSSGYSCKNGSCVRTCTAETCSGYTLTSCPSNGSCSSCTVKNTDCSSGATKYKLDSCAEGYRKDGNSCTFMCSGYMATKACGFGSYGDCGPGGVYSTCPYGSCYVKCNTDTCRNWGYSACWANTSDRWCSVMADIDILPADLGLL
ncbi:MAG: hypothetical protein ACLU99_12530 [Alphaproteobacteria bacterium]